MFRARRPDKISSWSGLGATLEHLKVILRGVGPSWKISGLSWVILGPSWLILGRSWSEFTLRVGSEYVKNHCFFIVFSLFLLRRISGHERTIFSLIGPLWGHIESKSAQLGANSDPSRGQVEVSWGYLGRRVTGDRFILGVKNERFA